MDPLTITALGTAVATILGASATLIRYVLKAVTEQRAEFTIFLSNHLSANTKALEAVAQTLEDLRREVHWQSIRLGATRTDE